MIPPPTDPIALNDRLIAAVCDDIRDKGNRAKALVEISKHMREGSEPNKPLPVIPMGKGAISGSREPSPGGLGPSGFDPGRKSAGYHNPADDEEMTAFIEGWNAALEGEDDFDLALHFWNRRRCGI